jgi:hypothetical protein
VFDVATAEPTPPLWFVVVAVLAIDVAAGCVDDVLRLDVLDVVIEPVELGAEVGTTVVSPGSLDRGAKRSTTGLSDGPVGASGEMYSGDGVVSNDVAAMTPAVAVAPSRPNASSHGPGRDFTPRSSLRQGRNRYWPLVLVPGGPSADEALAQMSTFSPYRPCPTMNP